MLAVGRRGLQPVLRLGGPALSLVQPMELHRRVVLRSVVLGGQLGVSGLVLGRQVGLQGLRLGGQGRLRGVGLGIQARLRCVGHTALRVAECDSRDRAARRPQTCGEAQDRACLRPDAREQVVRPRARLQRDQRRHRHARRSNGFQRRLQRRVEQRRSRRRIVGAGQSSRGLLPQGHRRRPRARVRPDAGFAVLASGDVARPTSIPRSATRPSTTPGSSRTTRTTVPTTRGAS